MTPATYRLSTYDVADYEEARDGRDFWGGRWTVRLAGLPLWGLRDAIRWARGQGYDDDLSILVERENWADDR